MYKFIREYGIESLCVLLAMVMFYLLATFAGSDVYDHIYYRAATTTQLTPAMRVGRLVNQVEAWKRQGYTTKHTEDVLDWAISERQYEHATITVLPPVLTTTVEIVVDYSTH
mgnify:FL=1